MERPEKEITVSTLNANFSQSSAAFLFNHQGCTCEELTGLRRKLRPTGAKLAVVKNSLARRAIADTDSAALVELFTGPTAVIWSGKDPVTPAKVLTDFAKTKEALQIKGGILDGSAVQAKDIEALAKLPSKEELLSKLLALINAPAVQLLRTINAPSSSLVRLLGAWKGEIEKKGGN